jgi:hypothetical protein
MAEAEQAANLAVGEVRAGRGQFEHREACRERDTTAGRCDPFPGDWRGLFGLRVHSVSLARWAVQIDHRYSRHVEHGSWDAPSIGCAVLSRRRLFTLPEPETAAG